MQTGLATAAYHARSHHPQYPPAIRLNSDWEAARGSNPNALEGLNGGAWGMTAAAGQAHHGAVRMDRRICSGYAGASHTVASSGKCC
jgi:hypothetical protein